MKHWPFYLLLLVTFVLLAVLFAGMVRSHLRTRGEESGVPGCECEDCDELMTVADVMAAPDSCSWELWEEQCDSLNPLVNRVKLIGRCGGDRRNGRG